MSITPPEPRADSRIGVLGFRQRRWARRMAAYIRQRRHADEIECFWDDGSACPYGALRVGQVEPHTARKFGRQATSLFIARPGGKVSMAIIVPYRHRQEHLRQFVPHMRRFLGEQAFRAQIYVIHQANEELFNKGWLMNVGFDLTRTEHTHFCFHDVDHLPVRAHYDPIDRPVALANVLAPEHPGYMGGVVLFPRAHFESINGFGNEFWHWGWEDEDIRARCLQGGLLPVVDPDAEFKRLPHPPSVRRAPDGTYLDSGPRLRVLQTIERRSIRRVWDFADGKLPHATGLDDLEYRLLATVEQDGYTRFDVTF